MILVLYGVRELPVPVVPAIEAALIIAALVPSLMSDRKLKNIICDIGGEGVLWLEQGVYSELSQDRQREWRWVPLGAMIAAAILCSIIGVIICWSWLGWQMLLGGFVAWWPSLSFIFWRTNAGEFQQEISDYDYL